MILGGGKEPAGPIIGKILHQAFGQLYGCREISLMASGLIHRDQSLTQIRVIFQVTMEMSPSGSIGSIQTPIRAGEG